MEVIFKTGNHSRGDFTSYTHSIYILSGIYAFEISHYNVILLFVIIKICSFEK